MASFNTLTMRGDGTYKESCGSASLSLGSNAPQRWRWIFFRDIKTFGVCHIHSHFPTSWNQFRGTKHFKSFPPQIPSRSPPVIIPSQQVVLHLYLVSCLCWSQPLLPLLPGLSHISLLQDMTDMAAAGEDMTAAADMATAAGDMAMMGESIIEGKSFKVWISIRCSAAGTPALMFLSTFLPGLGIGVLKGMLFSKWTMYSQETNKWPLFWNTEITPLLLLHYFESYMRCSWMGISTWLCSHSPQGKSQFCSLRTNNQT